VPLPVRTRSGQNHHTRDLVLPLGRAGPPLNGGETRIPGLVNDTAQLMNLWVDNQKGVLISRGKKKGCIPAGMKREKNIY